MKSAYSNCSLNSSNQTSLKFSEVISGVHFNSTISCSMNSAKQIYNLSTSVSKYIVKVNVTKTVFEISSATVSRNIPRNLGLRFDDD